jgi:hypothetical protein
MYQEISSGRFYLYVIGLLVIALLALGWLLAKLLDRCLRPIEQAASRFAKRKSMAMVSVGLAAILGRLAVLPVQPVPLPSVHDEFSNLLAADTYAHGRLTNPPHPMWVFLDTFHVLQHPTYASKYPPAPGIVLAVGQILGNPWIGTLISLGIMCTVFTWMFQGWFPAPWALLGGVLVLLRLCLFNYWFNNYYGAAITATGGACVLGAYPRLVRSARWRDGLILGIGAVLLLLGRPLEGFIFCVPVAVALVLHLLSARPAWTPTAALGWFAPALGVLVLGLAFFGYYNWRVTGHVFLAPYAVYQRDYFANYPIFSWQKVPPAIHYANPQFEKFFNSWNRVDFRLTVQDWAKRAVTAMAFWWWIYVGGPLTLTALGVPCVFSDRRMRLPLVQFVLCAFGLLSVVWFQPHYAAPLSATLFVLIVQAMRHLRRFTWSAKPIGEYLTRFVVLLMLGWTVVLAALDAQYPSTPWSSNRMGIAQQLRALPGKHLVLVVYAPTHNVHHEWIYNEADIDNSRIVWARVIPGRDLMPLLSYFKDRQVWIVHADSSPQQLERACTAEIKDPPVPCASLHPLD